MIVSHSSVSLTLRIIKQFNIFYLFFSNYVVPSPTMTTVISPSAASSSSLTTASMQPIRPGMFLKAYHIPTCYILQHETSLRFPEISTDVKIKKQTNKQIKRNKQKTTTATSIICSVSVCSRPVIVYLGQLEEHRPVPKQMDVGSNRPLVFQKLDYAGCILDHVAVHMIAI